MVDGGDGSLDHCLALTHHGLRLLGHAGGLLGVARHVVGGGGQLLDGGGHLVGLPLLIGDHLLGAAGPRFDFGGALHHVDAVLPHPQHQGAQGLQGHVVIPADGGQLILADDFDLLAEILGVDPGGDLPHPAHGGAQGEIGADHQVEIDQQDGGQRPGYPPEVALVGGHALV